MINAEMVVWPVRSEQLDRDHARPACALPAGMLAVALSNGDTVGPMFWHGGLECTASWLPSGGIRPPAVGWQEIAPETWGMTIIAYNEPWSDPIIGGEYEFGLHGVRRLGDIRASEQLQHVSDAIARELAQIRTPRVFVNDDPIVIPNLAGLVSVHLVSDGTTYRVLELPPLEFDDGEVRARRARVLRDDQPLSSEGVVVWGAAGQPPKLWPDGSHPLLDEPVTSHPLLAALADILVPTP